MRREVEVFEATHNYSSLAEAGIPEFFAEYRMVGNITGTEKMVAQILAAIDQVASSYYRLVLVVAPFRAGKTVALREVASQRGYPYINVSLELSRAMLELTQVQRCLYASRLLEEIAARAGGSCILLDNLGLLFEPSLKQDPLRLLKQLSRHRTVVAAWDGSIKDSYLFYAEPGHPEYRRYPVKNADFVIVEP